MDSISIIGDARRKLVMPGDTKDAKTNYSVKNYEAGEKHQVGTEFYRLSIHDV